MKTSAKLEKKKIQINSEEHCGVFQQCLKTSFLITFIAIFLECTHCVIPEPFILEVCNQPDMQARYVHKILTVPLQSTLNNFKYFRIFCFKGTFHLGWTDFRVLTCELVNTFQGLSAVMVWVLAWAGPSGTALTVSRALWCCHFEAQLLYYAHVAAYFRESKALTVIAMQTFYAYLE